MRLFQGSAAYYEQFRSRYPLELASEVAQTAELLASDLVVDLGCGTGVLADIYGQLGFRVVGIDPEPEMLREARQKVRHFSPAPTFVLGSSETITEVVTEAPALVVIGRAFHWMHRSLTLATLDRWMPPGGTVALFEETRLNTPEMKWRSAFDDVVSAYDLGAGTRYVERDHTASANEVILLQSAFSKVTRRGLLLERRVSVADLVGRSYSMAGTSPEDLGARRVRFVADLTAALHPFADSAGLLPEFVEARATIGRRDLMRSSGIPE